VLESGLDRPVIDDTGLTGRYVLKMHTGVVDTRDFLRCSVTSLASPLHRSDAMYRYWSYVSADRASNHGMPHTHRGHRANAELTCRAEAPSLFGPCGLRALMRAAPRSSAFIAGRRRWVD